MGNIFNVYYVNFEKASEISMLFNNKILSEVLETRNKARNSIEIPECVPNTYSTNNINLPSINENEKLKDVFKVINTKSTILKTIYEETLKKDIKIEKCNPGDVIRIKDVSLAVINLKEVMSIKSLLNGITMKLTADNGISLDVISLLRVIFKDAAYILRGHIDNNDDTQNDSLLLKIPMSTYNEMESQYSISDIEVGKVSILGIYRGKFDENDMIERFKSIMSFQSDSSSEEDFGIEEGVEEISLPENNKSKAHYIDVIAILQDLNVEEKNDEKDNSI